MGSEKREKRFIHSKAWKDAVSEPDATQKSIKLRELISKLDVDAISSLISFLDADPGDEIYTVFFLLKGAIAEKKLSEQHRLRLLRSLKSLLSDYPDSPSRESIQAFYVMLALAPEEAEQFLLSLDSSAIPDDKYSGFYIALFGSFHSAAALERLFELAKLKGWKGKTAKAMLEARGIVDERKIRSLAKKWQESVSSKHLGELYEIYISRYRGPIKPLIELLGYPTSHKGTDYTYATKEGHRLLLEADEQNRLKGAHFG